MISMTSNDSYIPTGNYRVAGPKEWNYLNQLDQDLKIIYHLDMWDSGDGQFSNMKEMADKLDVSYSRVRTIRREMLDDKLPPPILAILRLGAKRAEKKVTIIDRRSELAEGLIKSHWLPLREKLSNDEPLTNQEKRQLERCIRRYVEIWASVEGTNRVNININQGNIVNHYDSKIQDMVQDEIDKVWDDLCDVCKSRIAQKMAPGINAIIEAEYEDL